MRKPPAFHCSLVSRCRICFVQSKDFDFLLMRGWHLQSVCLLGSNPKKKICHQGGGINICLNMLEWLHPSRLSKMCSWATMGNFDLRPFARAHWHIPKTNQKGKLEESWTEKLVVPFVFSQNQQGSNVTGPNHHVITRIVKCRIAGGTP